MNRASILDLKLVQAFPRVSRARDPITSIIFWIRSLDLLRDFALTLNSESKGLQPGEPHLRKVLLEPVLHLFHGMSGAKSADYHGSCSFLSICLCWNLSFCSYLCFGTQLRRFGQKNFSKKLFFNVTVKLLKCSGNIAATLYMPSFVFAEGGGGGGRFDDDDDEERSSQKSAPSPGVSEFKGIISPCF